MMNRLLIFFTLFTALTYRVALAQTTVSGTVQDARGAAIVGANIYLDGTYDGTSTDTTGAFRFSTHEAGEYTLMASAIGYQTHEHTVLLSNDSTTQVVVLQEAINKMDGVTVTASAFGVSDQQSGHRMKPLDIVTTAGALGDISGALQTMPGTQTVAEDGRLFVRGGAGHETKTFMDGMLVHEPYGASGPNVPTRGRFSPFLFKGTTFSTGGYSAEYGQALSAALALNSVDLAPQTQTDISVMSVGVDATHQHRWNDASLMVKGEYTNLSPYQSLIKQEVDWDQAPVAGGGSVAFRRKTSATGLLKLYGYANYGQLAMQRARIEQPTESDAIRVKNTNVYLNGTYQEALGKRWSVRTGLSYTHDQEMSAANEDQLDETYAGLHAKATASYDASEHLTLRGGLEHHTEQGTQHYRSPEGDTLQRWEAPLTAGFVEADLYASSRWVARVGGRWEVNKQEASHLAPRLSLAYKTGSASQVSLAYGSFYQRPEGTLLGQSSTLSTERATHYVASYRVAKQGRTFRAEAFHKRYDDLVKTTGSLNNQGYGYARGVELFWRDRTTIKNGEYWLSYSLLDAQREALHFPTLATPTFAARHTLSAVYKHFIPALKVQVGASYRWATGRPYHNPNHNNFHRDRTPNFNSLNLNVAYLIRQHIILYASATNVLGADNVFGYRYAAQPNERSTYGRQAVRPAAPRFLFVGLFITLSRDRQANQLDNL